MNKRKILAVLMAAIVMIASMPGLTVQGDTIGKEAQACKELGVLIGADSAGVTPQYLETTPTRIQAFIIVLRLKGLYNEATEYEGDSNFKDAYAAGWAKNYMAYAKSHSELGWGGYPDGTFAPANKISGQAFYKVMLETLGYKQDIDFTYADTLKFAQSIGLVKKAADIAKLTNFTVDDVAKGIYGALNIKPKGSAKKLITVMVEKNIITSEKAVAAGFALDTKDAKVLSFNAISNNKIQVEFDQNIFLQKADVEISETGGSSRLSVLSIESQGKEAIISTTEAKPFNAYELAINTLVPTNNMVIRGYKMKFVAMPKDTVKPTAKHEIIGRNEILVTFSEEVAKSSAENLSNYLIEHDVVVLSAELRESGKAVILKTTDMSPNSFYRLNIQNISDIAGNSMDRYTALFEGMKRDLQGPSVITVISENNTSVAVTFNERVDKVSAENVGNYEISNGLSVTGARLDESGKAVVLSTAIQQSGTIYNLTVQNVSDTWGNTLYRKDYRFVSDSTRPAVSVIAISNNEVQVAFSKRMDKKSAEDVSNYSIDKGLNVKDAILDESGKVVTLITSGQTLRELYTVTIMQVFDAWGNMTNIYSGKFGGMPVDTKELNYTVKSSGNEIIVTFNKRVDKETAEDVFNYVLDSSLGYAAKAELDDSGRVVTLLTADHTSGKMYSITVENIKDVFGNLISTDDKVCSKKFVGIGSSGSESGTFALETVVTVNVNTIDLIFSDELTSDELNGMEVEVAVPKEYNHSLPSDLDYYKYFIGNKKNVRIQFKTNSSKNPELFKAGSIYEAEITGLERLSNKNDANIKMFAGTGNPNEAPAVLEVNAINNTAVEVVFSEPVKGITKYQFEIKDRVTISGVSVEDSSEITDSVILYISSNTKLADGEYKLYVKSGIKDAAGLNSIYTEPGSSSSYAEFYGTSEDNESPIADSNITILDSYTIQFEFNEPIQSITNSSFSVRKVSGSSFSILNISKAVLSDDRRTVTLYLNTRYAGLDSDYEYELVINSSVKDLQGLAVDSDNRKIEFGGVDIEPEELEIVASYIDEGNKLITLLTNRKLNISSLSMDDFKLSGAGYYKSSSDEVTFDDKSITIKLRNELDSNKELIIEITSSGRGKIKDYNNQELSTDIIEMETN